MTSTTHKNNETPWKCVCGTLLGVIDSSKEVIRIKYKDLYLYFSGGIIVVICRGCGRPNKLVDAACVSDSPLGEEIEAVLP